MSWKVWKKRNFVLQKSEKPQSDFCTNPVNCNFIFRYCRLKQWYVCACLFIAGSFTTDVWRSLVSGVPHGHTASYRELAEFSGHAGASRAVGQAMRRNPVPLLIPCHRVIRSNGLAGNYAGGQRNFVKHWLLMLEKSHRKKNVEVPVGCTWQTVWWNDGQTCWLTVRTVYAFATITTVQYTA